MKYNHVMIDLETFDVKPSGVIVSIGAVIFHPLKGLLKDEEFYAEIDIKRQPHRTKDKETLQWWKGQKPKVKEALKGKELLEDVLYDFALWLPPNCKVWGNGATFDISILENAYNQYDEETPWKFWNVRDMRTIKALYEDFVGGWQKQFTGTPHHALDDAKQQAVDVIKINRYIYKKFHNKE